MSDWATGFAAGIAVGLAIGLASGRRKPWSELSENQRKIRLGMTVGLGLLVVAGFVAWFVASSGKTP